MYHKVTLNDFTGGLVKKVRSDMIADNQCQELNNLEVNQSGVLEKRSEPERSEIMTGLNGDVIQGYLWNTYFKRTGRSSNDHIILITKSGSTYYLYVYYAPEAYDMINTFNSMPKIAITDKRVYVVNGKNNSYLYSFLINKDGEIEKGIYNVESPDQFCSVIGKTEIDWGNTGNTTLIPYGAILQYCYTYTDEEGRESSHSPIMTYSAKQFLYKKEAGEDTEESISFVYAIESTALSNIKSPASKKIKTINIYRRHALYTESPEGFTNFYLVKQLSVNYATANDNSAQSEVSLEDSSYLIKGDEVLFIDNTLFVTNGLKDLTFNLDGKHCQTILINNTSTNNYIKKIITIFIPADNEIKTAIDSDPNNVRIIDMDRQTPLKWCYQTNGAGLFIHVAIPYIYANTDHALYVLSDCTISGTWNSNTYGKPYTNYLTFINDQEIEHLVKDMQCVECIGRDSYKGAFTKVNYRTGFQVLVSDTDSYPVQDKISGDYLALMVNQLSWNDFGRFEIPNNKYGYVKFQIVIDTDIIADKEFFAYTIVTNETEVGDTFTFSILYYPATRKLVLRRLLENTSTSGEVTIYTFTSGQVTTGVTVQLLLSFNFQPYSDPFKFFCNVWTRMFQGLTLIEDFEETSMEYTPFITRRTLKESRYRIVECMNSCLYFSHKEYIDTLDKAKFMLDLGGFAGVYDIGAKLSGTWSNENITFKDPESATIENRGLVYFTNEKMQFPPLNYIATRSKINKAISSPYNGDEQNYNSLVLFNDTSIDRVIIQKDYQGILLNRNVVSELYNHSLKYTNMIESVGDSIYWISEQGIVKYNQNGITNLTEDRIGIDKAVTESSFVQFLPDKKQIWFYFDKSYCLVYDIARNAFLEFTGFIQNYVKGYFKDKNVFFGKGIRLNKPVISPTSGSYNVSVSISIAGGSPQTLTAVNTKYSYPSIIKANYSIFKSKKFKNNLKIKKIKLSTVFSNMIVDLTKDNIKKTIQLEYDETTQRYELPIGSKGDIEISLQNPESIEIMDLYLKGE